MLVSDNEVMFFESDMRFVKRFGLEAATDMVLDYSAINKTPFIYDFFQLSSFLLFDNLYYAFFKYPSLLLIMHFVL